LPPPLLLLLLLLLRIRLVLFRWFVAVPGVNADSEGLA
jgi:hypothetical protein